MGLKINHLSSNYAEVSVNYFFALLETGIKTPAEVDQFFKNPTLWLEQHKQQQPLFNLLKKLEAKSQLTEDERTQVNGNKNLQKIEEVFSKKTSCSIWSLFNRALCTRCRQKEKTSPPPSPKATPISSPPVKPLSEPLKAPVPSPKIETAQPAKPAALKRPAAPPATGPASPISPPELPWDRNNCFIAAAIWAYLVADPVNLKQLQTARGPAADLLRAILINQDREAQSNLLSCLRTELHALRPRSIPNSDALDTMGDPGPVCEAIHDVLYPGQTEFREVKRFKITATHQLTHQTTTESCQSGPSIALPGNNLADFRGYLQNYFNEPTDGVLKVEGKSETERLVQTQIRYPEAPSRIQFHFQMSPQRIKAPAKLDLRYLMTSEGPPAYFVLRSAILKRGLHFISLICQNQPDGQTRYLLCDNMARPQIREISKSQAEREMQEGSCDFIYTPA